ncbi:MAG TPA: beta-N-acetylhexosaminidase [Cyclobacteriaceae bacterium]|nr:beta-N-acetylhexosaminidase [Cyclobacteriaceae bacterium]
MLRKILVGLVIILALISTAGVFYYFKFIRPNQPPISAEDRAKLTLMPLPAKIKLDGGTFELTNNLTVNWISFKDKRLERALTRFYKHIRYNPEQKKDESECSLSIECNMPWDSIQQVREDESYTIDINSSSIKLKAETPYGILHGLETLAQLAKTDNGKIIYPTLNMLDKPRYPWRGLMLDVCRHWMPKEVVLRNLDALSAVKMNVMHLHLSEYQGFRVESKVFPKLHELGSNGKYYTQDDIREILAYARDRGIRIVPEFDLPGHSTSFFVGYPELASSPGPYTLDKKFGVLTPVIDPTREEVYQFLDTFLGEMASLFPDPYLHIGGDEVVPHDWDTNESIQAFMKEKKLKDHHDLQNYFNTRLKKILTKHGKKMVGWDEILHPDLGTDITVQSWRGQKSLFVTVQAGSNGILSSGWYLDHKLPASKHYQVDPEILPGAITITPDTLNWQQWNLILQVSENKIPTTLTLYGKPDNLRGTFSLMENITGFETATLQNNKLKFTFASDYGSIDVDGDIKNDSIKGTMSLGLLSFKFAGIKAGGNDIEGTKPPVVEQIKPLTEDQKQLILGGEAALWAEVVTEKNVDSRIWPRTAAIAEKLWSPQLLTKDIDDMYRRLDYLSTYLNSLELKHISGYNDMLQQLAESKSVKPLKTLVDALEEVKYYDRMNMYKDLSTDTPLDEVVDAAQPESYTALKFIKMTEAFISDSTHQKNKEEIQDSLQRWIDNDTLYQQMAAGNYRLEKAKGLSTNLAELSTIGLTAMNSIVQHHKMSEEEFTATTKRIKELDEHKEGMLIAITPAIVQLVGACK